jgi:hypothetical protein
MKETESIQVAFENFEPLLLERKVAIALVKQQADAVFVWSDFGWVKTHKYILLDILETMKQETIQVIKVPKWSTYRFKMVPA